jgi:hypothetical protein
MIRTLRAFFLARVLREKLLLVGFLALGVIMWASAFSTRVGQFFRSEHATTVALKDQEYWLGRRASIEAATQKAAAQMDPAKTLDPTNLSVVVRQLAGDAGIAKNMSSLGSGAAMSSGQFSINTVRLRIINTEWHDFAVFYQHLQERAPYLAITELAMQPVRGNPGQVMASMTVASFEIRH